MFAATLRVLGWIAVAQAGLLALALVARKTSGTADRLLAGLLAIIAASAGGILASHAAVPARLLGWLDLADLVLTLAAGPTLAAWIATRLSSATTPPRWWLPALAPAAVVALLGIGAATRDAPFALPRWGLAVAIGMQCGFTVLAVLLYWRRRNESRSTVAAAALGGMLLVHVAQFVRFRTGDSFQDIVPATLTLLLFALAFVALRESPALAPRRGSSPALPGPEAARVLADLEHLFTTERAHLDPGLSLSRTARRLGVPAATLSRAVNQTGGQRFTDLVNERRVAHARHLLADPELRHLSVEAIGLRSGFQARSTFFDAFRRHAGTTPAEYRERAF